MQDKPRKPKTLPITEADKAILPKDYKYLKKEICKVCGFTRIFIDGRTGQWLYCPRCGTRTEW